MTDDRGRNPFRIRADHVAFAVKSIDQGYDFFSRNFPTLPRNDRTRTDQASGSFYWKDLFVGGFPIEFIEELPGGSTFITRFIERHGEGLHHLTFEVDRLEPVLERLRFYGVRIVDEERFEEGYGSATAFISPRSVFSSVIQFWDLENYDAPRPWPSPDPRFQFDHVAIGVDNLKAAVEILCEALGATICRRDERLEQWAGAESARLDVAGVTLELVQKPLPSERFGIDRRAFNLRTGGLLHIALKVAELDAVAAGLEHRGGEIVRSRGPFGAAAIPARIAFGAPILLLAN